MDRTRARHQQRRPRAALAAGLLLPALALTSAAHGGTSGPLTDLGTLGGTHSFGRAVNSSGVVVGESYLAGNTGTHAIVHLPSDIGLTDLGVPSGDTSSLATAVTDGGLVGGHSFAGGGLSHAFTYELGTGTWTIAPGPSTLEDLAEDGTAVGSVAVPYCIFPSSPGEGADWRLPCTIGVRSAPMVWDSGGGSLSEIPGFGGLAGAAHAINEHGLVVGESQIADHSESHAFTYDLATSTLTDLNPLVGADWSRAVDVNDAGLVLGQGGSAPNIIDESFLYDTVTGHITDLDAVLGPTLYVSGLGPGGIVVGYTSPQVPGPTFHAMAYDSVSGELLDLGDLADPGGEVSWAEAISDTGIVTGWSRTGEADDVHAFTTSVTFTPGPPAAPTVAGCGPYADVRWAPPSFDGFDPVSAYDVDADGSSVATGVAGRRYVDEGSVAGTDYQVSAVNGAGTSRPSESAEFAGAPCPSFGDVLAGHPFRRSISLLAAAGVVVGYPDGTFRGANGVTREAMMAFLWREAGSPPGPFPDPGFTDVGPVSPFRTAIGWAHAEGIANGFADGGFHPGAIVTRQATLAFLWRVAGEPEPGDPPTAAFTDVPISHQFFAPIAWAAAHGIAAGYPDGSFRPSRDVTRQAAASFLDHAHDVTVD